MYYIPGNRASELAAFAYRPELRALAGQYRGQEPVGLWQLWAPDGKLVAYRDFDNGTVLTLCR